MADSQVRIDNLLIVDVPHASRIPTSDLSWKNGAFFPAEECDRQLLIGTVDDVNLIPQAIRDAAVKPSEAKQDSAVIMETGVEAYRHLLNVSVGMLDKQLGEKETIEGIRSNWLRFSENNDSAMARKAKFGNIVQYAFADSKAVRAKVFEDRVGGNYLRPVSSEPAIAARNMLDIKPVDKVLIIGEKDGITLNTLKAVDTAFRLQTQDETRDSGIVMTHPDPHEYALLVPLVQQLQKDKKLKGSVEFKPYDVAMSDHFKRADFVFNCQPMDNGAKDAKMLEAVGERTNQNSILVHMKGVPQNRNITSTTWKEAAPESVFFVEDLKRQDQLDRVHNQRMRDLAERAIHNCITSRKDGRQPVKDKILMKEGEYEAFVTSKPAAPPGDAPRPFTERAERRKGEERRL
jgi:hypothetical protein